jgi:hypothetical protein
MDAPLPTMTEVSNANTVERRLSPMEERDCELLNRILVGNDRDALNEWRQLDADWRRHIWKLYDNLYLGDESVALAVYV